MLTSLRCIPVMKSSPDITASNWPRLTATSSDSKPRLRDRGRRQVARTAAKSAPTTGPVWPPAAALGGPPVPRQHPGGSLTGQTA